MKYSWLKKPHAVGHLLLLYALFTTKTSKLWINHLQHCSALNMEATTPREPAYAVCVCVCRMNATYGDAEKTDNEVNLRTNGWLCGDHNEFCNPAIDTKIRGEVFGFTFLFATLIYHHPWIFQPSGYLLLTSTGSNKHTQTLNPTWESYKWAQYFTFASVSVFISFNLIYFSYRYVLIMWLNLMWQ